MYKVSIGMKRIGQIAMSESDDDDNLDANQDEGGIEVVTVGQTYLGVFCLLKM